MIAGAMITHTTRALLVSLSLALSACGGEQKPAAPDAKAPDAGKTAAAEKPADKAADPAKTAAAGDSKVKVVDGPGDDRFVLKGTPPADADDFERETGKFEKYFSEKPGRGS